jgi:hypothetical protein
MSEQNWPAPTQDAIDNAPDQEQAMEMVMEGTAEATDGCDGIEPDGECEHGYPSWPLYLGLI